MNFFSKLLRRLGAKGNDSFFAPVSISGSGLSGSVSVQKALKLAVLYACVQAIAQDVSKLPLLVYKDTPKGKERFPKHPLYRILRGNPNPFMTSYHWRLMTMFHVLTNGNAYSEIVRQVNGDIELWPLLPERVTLKMRERDELVFSVSSTKGTKELKFMDVLHIKGLTMDGLVGMSPLKAGARSINFGVDTQESAHKQLTQGFLPGLVVKTPDALTPEAKDRLRKELDEASAGVVNVGRALLMQDGLTAERLAFPAKELQMLESQAFSVQEIPRFFRMPPHKIGDLARATFSNIEHSAIEYVTDTLMPWLTNIEQEISLKLIPEKEQGVVFAEFLVEGLLRGDIKSRYEAYASAINSGFMSRNEVRSRENLMQRSGADALLVPLNMTTAGGNENAS